MKLVNRGRDALAFVFAMALFAPAAFAQVDTTAAEAAIDDAYDAVLVIGAAVFVVAVGIKLYKWLKRAL